ncbi:CDP-glycerol glycerophosphotransferase family protein [Geodermatophilus sp. DSM 44513]|uniref:CDP-glycerol glycerophosphotransferase family protein n=1 Tax=Geodermatophilus sp. DSM 44513 TaxID=1528104 RepID=UPI00141292BC|nr:CDP-glycerol glycerophosphotransferase family protein [Geodermatophilus sp. DSM 44513]WNV76696.1 CDP-glycerol glycerophosphotransferase family protein [Geodermatophilus sp. DSM 44513]
MRFVWSSFRGRYADNPRALYEAVAARGHAPEGADGPEHTWLCTAATRGTFPAGVRTVLQDAPEARTALEAADVVVANDCLSLEWDKSPGATYLQTWHGTPLKRIHHDAPARPGWLDAADRDVARWDHLLSPNAWSTERLRRAFGFRGPVHETGYPRNDVLSSPDRDVLRARTRARLGIPEGTTAVLYAPTWRDDQVLDHTGGSGADLPIDLDDLTARLGSDHVLLVRLHSIVADRLELPDGVPVLDVSDEPDPAELYLAADVLVTDYSSVMVDFAVTGKPVLLFAYDLDHYRNDLRGFYVDLAEVAPGPLLTTSAELVDALADLDAAMAPHTGRYAAFRQTFCHLEDGHATERVLDLLTPSAAAAGTTTRGGDDRAR